MARGWESKSVEEQQSQADFPGQPRQNFTTAQIAKQKQTNGLLLSRKRLQQRLESVKDPNHRQMLEQALQEIERQIAALK